MADTKTTKLRPIDAFVKYFLDVKPYHTKLLEVVERYKFTEEMAVGIIDTMFAKVKYVNTPLCRPVGWGLVFDECGFSNDNCCDLFQCLGGYGIIWDNSDLVASHTIEEFDTTADEIVLDGNLTFDRRLEIIKVNTDTIIVRGDHLADFNNHRLFLIAPFNVYSIVSLTGNKVTVTGNREQELLTKREFRIRGTNSADGLYGVRLAVYDESSDTTQITIAGNRTLSGDIFDGYIETETSPQNQGFYQVSSASLQTGKTVVRLRPGTSFPVQGTVNMGSVQLRTGFIAPRQIWLTRQQAPQSLAIPQGITFATPTPSPSGEEPSPSPTPSATPTPTPTPAPPAEVDMYEYRIADAYYNISTNKTHIVLAEQLERIDDPDFVPGEARLYGYMTTSGYDNNEECDAPKPTNIHTLFGETLLIRIIQPDVVNECGSGLGDRIVEGGEGRITEDGECRIIE
jgi:hypothetical protein